MPVKAGMTKVGGYFVPQLDAGFRWYNIQHFAQHILQNSTI